MRRSTWRSLVLVLLLASMLAACATPAQPTAAPAAEPAATALPAAEPEPSEAAAPTAAPVQPTPAPQPTAAPEKKVLRLLWWEAPTLLNPHLAISNANGHAGNLIVEPLAAWNSKGELEPILAAEVPTVANGGVSEDYTTMTWKLKQGVKWSDGTDFTAEDVIFNYEYLSNPDVGSGHAGPYLDFDKIEMLDPYTVKVTFKAPTPNPYLAFVGAFGLLLQKTQFEAYNGKNVLDAPGNVAPIGTGPFRLVTFKPGDVAVYERNPLYREADSVYFDEVMLKGGGDAVSAARAVLQTGDFDYAGSLEIEKDVLLNLMENASAGNIVTYPDTATTRILLNHANPDPSLGDKRSEPDTRHPFLSDVRVRRALAMAVDRELIATQLWGPSGTATCTVLSHLESLKSTKHAWGTCPVDIEGAKKLLDEAGWVDSNGNGIRDKDGVEMKMLFQSDVNTLKQKMQEVIKAGWEQLGVSVELKAIDNSIHYSSDPGNPDTSSKFYADAEMYGNGVAAGSAAVIRYMQFWVSSNASSQANQWKGRNVERYINPEFDAMYEQLSTMTDEAERNALAIKMADLLTDDQASIPLVLRNKVVAMSNDLKGVEMSTFSTETWNIAEWHK